MSADQHGAEWERKGMSRAIELASLLNARGLPTELTIVGARPPNDGLPAFGTAEGFIDKRQADGERRLSELLIRSHFHVLFSQAEAFGVVFAEANAHAVPNIASDVGGIPSAVVNGLGGQRFDPAAPLADVAAYVEGCMRERQRYLDLCRNARREYDERLNWRVSGHTVRALLKAACQRNIQ